ncbi:MAG: serine/threonine-protein phosphatase, partial [Bacteroidota bacterium]|nr:serine/threonine-protein phosphatase [Bacteroidota bacterium]
QSDENQKLQLELEQMKLFFSELETTNKHLISATWRERDMKKQLAETLAELKQTKVLVDAQNKRISESINYARKIQLAINATEQDICTYLKNSFVLYRPKDIISGDFPWYLKRGQYVYIAAVDCTGHGVPGAMMSMIGNLLLNDIANGSVILDPGDILLKLHHAVVRTLKQDVPGSDSNSGMDIGLCRYNLETGELKYAGAHRPMFLLRNGILEVISGDKFPIGGLHYKGKNTFTTHVLSLEKGESVILFSDGYPDQIGGPNEKKIMTSGLKELILKTPGNNMSEMKDALENAFENWRGDNKQIDDVLVIGLGF